jgi:hypothetical protein
VKGRPGRETWPAVSRLQGVIDVHQRKKEVMGEKRTY